MAGLLRYIIATPEVNFGDSRLFFADLRNELDHPYYPEVCVGYQGQQPELLSVSDTVNDYSLMERPVRDESDRTTNENLPKLLIVCWGSFAAMWNCCHTKRPI
jgi:S-DNA-T family DNA segregation ATPase FtsK/SpoIIIE